MYVMGLCIFIFNVILSVLLTANYDLNRVWFFFDTPTILITLLAIIGQLVATSGFKTFIAGVNALFSKKYYLSDETAKEAVSLFKLLSKTTVAIGIVLTMIGLLSILHNLSDPASLGPMTAVALMSIFYSSFISFFVFESAAYVLNRRKNSEAATSSYVIKITDLATIRKLVDLCNQNGINPEDIKNANEIIVRNNKQQR